MIGKERKGGKGETIARERTMDDRGRKGGMKGGS